MKKKVTYERTERKLREIGENIVEKIRFQLAQDNSNASGRTSRDTKSKVVRRVDSLTMGIKSRKVKKVDVLGVIDKGRLPSLPPPYKRIAKWMRDKNIVTKGSKQSPRDINRVAYAIAQSIGRWGIKPKNTIREAIGPYRFVFEDMLLEEMGKDIDEFIATNMPKKNIKK